MAMMEKWLNAEFESSCSETLQFREFVKDYKKTLKAILFDKYEIVEFHKMHFEFSAFIKNRFTGKLVYLAISDVRFWGNNWYNNILIRTAKDTKDFTGGSNNYIELNNLITGLDRLSG